MTLDGRHLTQSKSKSSGYTVSHSEIIKPTKLAQIRSKAKPFLCILLFSLALLSVWRKYRFSQDIVPPVGDFIQGKGFDWDNVSPTSYLKWRPCGKGTGECARLEVPLDYAEPGGHKAAIALLRIPAKDKKNYRGPILFNPGGPGGSGVDLINNIGEVTQQLLGDEFDIVGFDPRGRMNFYVAFVDMQLTTLNPGMSATTPTVIGFSNNIERAYWTAGAPSSSNSTPENFQRAFARSKLESELIMSRMGQSHVLEHVGTATVARDMLTITEAFGQERLNYWGFSYGTVLGSTFSFMFPDKVGRVVIDGVLDYPTYYSGVWSKALSDTDKIMSYIYDECVAAGKECPLHAETPSKVEGRLHAILESLKSKPMTAFDGTNYNIVDYGVTKRALFLGLYTPFRSVRPLFEAFAALEKGNATLMMQWTNAHRLDEPATCTPEPTIAPKSVPEGSRAIGCGDSYCDGDGNCRSITIKSLRDDLEEMSQFSIFADVFIDLSSMACAGWTVPTKEKYGDQFNTTTSSPLLIIGNTYDPVTPLFGAMAAAKSFTNSVLMTVDTPGHCSIAATSPSAMRYIREYFREGKLPPEGTICPIADKLFPKGETDLKLQNGEEDEGWLNLVNRFTDNAQQYQVKYGSWL